MSNSAGIPAFAGMGIGLVFLPEEKPMQKITPCVWFNGNAEEAVAFYSAAFGNSKINGISCYSTETPGKMPVGSVMMVSFSIDALEFLALNGGPVFQPNPSISFFVNRRKAEEIEAIWNRLIEGGQALMPLGSYPFSEKYGWVQDKYGISWQLNLCGDEPGIVPFLMFTREQNGKAAEAAKFYTSLLPDSKIESVTNFGDAAGGANKPEDAINVSFTLAGQKFMAMDGGGGDMHKFSFNEGLSLLIHCDTQEEVDRLWHQITVEGGGEESVCGWCRDRFGVFWQITPRILLKMVSDPDTEKAARAMKAMMEMGKIDIAELKRAFAN